MNKVKEAHVPYNSGWAGDLKNGQVIRIIATTTVDFVCMRQENLKERFDQARTKVYNMKIFITTGDKLMGRNNQHMMTIIEDTNREGTHDLQKGMCSGYRFQLAKKEGKLRDYYHRDYKNEEIPDHGCYENLSRVLAPYGIDPEEGRVTSSGSAQPVALSSVGNVSGGAGPAGTKRATLPVW